MSIVSPIRYLDPGTGSMILQYLAGGLLAILLVIKLYLKKIKQKIKNIIVYEK